MTKIAIIGGSGLENPDILQHQEKIVVGTSYDAPSSDFLSGTIAGTEVVLLSRHGRDHTIPPSQVNNRANLDAIRQAVNIHILLCHIDTNIVLCHKLLTLPCEYGLIDIQWPKRLFGL